MTSNTLSVVSAEKEAVVKRMEKFFSPTGQTTLFPSDNLLDLCISYLEKSGYVVVKSRLDPDINSISDIVPFFYSCITSKRKKLYISPIADRDLKLASIFVEEVMYIYDCSKEAAIKICASVIYTVVIYESHFGFKSLITDFSVFTKTNLRWLIKKAFDIMDNEGAYLIDPSDDYYKQWDDFVEEYISNNGEEAVGFNL